MFRPNEVVVLKKAPPRKRPRRVAKKIAQRYGAKSVHGWRALFYQVFCRYTKELGNAAAVVLNNIVKDALYPESLYSRSFWTDPPEPRSRGLAGLIEE